MQMNSQAPCRL